MDDFRFPLHRRALAGFGVLTREERDALQRALAPLAGSPERDWSSKGARRLDLAEPLYLVPVDDSLRAIVRPAAGGQPEVVDLVRHELLERYFQGAG